MPRRGPNPDDPGQQQFKDTPFKVWQIKSYMGLVPIKKKLDEKYGEGMWGMDEAATEKLASKKVKGEKVEEVKFVRRGSIRTRVERYLQTFKDVTPNDLQTITAMCNLELQMESVEDELATKKGLGVDDRKKLGELYAKLSTEHRQLQTVLGILRSQRESEMDTAAEIKRFIHGAKQKIEDEGILIACPHCQEKMALNQGVILYHFRQSEPWQWQSRCPNQKCKKMFTLKSENFDESPIPF